MCKYRKDKKQYIKYKIRKVGISVSISKSMKYNMYYVLFCSLAVLDPRVGHTMDVISPFISVLCRSD